MVGKGSQTGRPVFHIPAVGTGCPVLRQARKQGPPSRAPALTNVPPTCPRPGPTSCCTPVIVTLALGSPHPWQRFPHPARALPRGAQLRRLPRDSHPPSAVTGASGRRGSCPPSSPLCSQHLQGLEGYEHLGGWTMKGPGFPCTARRPIPGTPPQSAATWHSRRAHGGGVRAQGFEDWRLRADF